MMQLEHNEHGRPARDKTKLPPVFNSPDDTVRVFAVDCMAPVMHQFVAEVLLRGGGYNRYADSLMSMIHYRPDVPFVSGDDFGRLYHHPLRFVWDMIASALYYLYDTALNYTDLGSGWHHMVDVSVAATIHVHYIPPERFSGVTIAERVRGRALPFARVYMERQILHMMVQSRQVPQPAYNTFAAGVAHGAAAAAASAAIVDAQDAAARAERAALPVEARRHSSTRFSPTSPQYSSASSAPSSPTYSSASSAPSSPTYSSASSAPSSPHYAPTSPHYAPSSP